jgi:transglutaminase-like putative cysteine protease
MATCLIALDGLVALYFGDLIGPGVAVLVGAAVCASWWQESLRRVLGPMPSLDRIVVPLATGLALVDLVYLAPTILDGFVHLLLFLLLYRLFTRRSLRDARDVGFLSFLMLVASSAVTLGVEFLFAFLAFLVLGVWVFMLHHVLTEAERGAEHDEATPVAAARLGPALFVLSVAASAATLGITVALFFIIPRVGLAALPLRTKMGVMVSGFSDRVELGAFGEIETDPTVVMRVHFPEGPAAPELLPGLRWRGIVFDHFDGRAWNMGPQRGKVVRTAPGQFDLARYRGNGTVLVQEIYLEPIGTEVVFAAPRLLRLAIRTDAVTVDDMGAVSVPAAASRLRYVALSQLESLEPPRARHDEVGPLDPASAQRYLQLPVLPSRIPRLARQVVGTSGSYDAAVKLTDFLSREFRYTVALRRETALEPLEEFLFVTKAGNCEYFAAALAVMLRTVGVPARVVGGFQRGEWNPYGRYFMVRNRDAHSWVEAYVDGVGWMTFDPSPRAVANPVEGFGPVTFYLDALRMRWYRYVVNWSLRDQVSTAESLQRGAVALRRGVANAMPWTHASVPLSWVALAVGVVIAVVLVVRPLVERWRRPPGPPVPPFYAEALRRLAGANLRPSREETAREFLVRASTVLPGCGPPLGDLTRAYEHARFASTPLPPATIADVGRALAALRDAASARPPTGSPRR